MLHTNLPSSANEEMALLLLDIVKSTDIVQQAGDSAFIERVQRLHRNVRGHRRSGEIRFLKCTGDGFLAVFRDVEAAVDVAREVGIREREENTQLRLVIHRGRVKTGPDGDPLGLEVHRLFRLEAVRDANLPEHGRILISRPAVEALDRGAREHFEPIGTFHLEGFEKPEELWVEK